jgi:3-oxoacyl-[acyl-carrier protein] reductase
MAGERRHAVVSGGGTGIGRATAQALARRGDMVTILGRRAEVLEGTAAELDAELGAGVADWHAVDLADPRAVEAFARAFDRPVDVLVNAAGGLDRSEEDGLAGLAEHWLGALRLNVLTAVLLTRSLVDRLRRPGGRVILLSSIAALRGGGDAYSAAKAALHGWAYSLAGELGPEGITVNVVAPGYVADTEFFAGGMTAAREAGLVGQTVVGRPGRPEDVAAAIVFLASEEARHITGEIVQVNGGALFGR